MRNLFLTEFWSFAQLQCLLDLSLGFFGGASPQKVDFRPEIVKTDTSQWYQQMILISKNVTALEKYYPPWN